MPSILRGMSTTRGNLWDKRDWRGVTNNDGNSHHRVSNVLLKVTRWGGGRLRLPRSFDLPPSPGCPQSSAVWKAAKPWFPRLLIYTATISSLKLRCLCYSRQQYCPHWLPHLHRTWRIGSMVYAWQRAKLTWLNSTLRAQNRFCHNCYSVSAWFPWSRPLHAISD